MDSGIVEYIRREDIFTEVIASNIPILTGKYVLDSVVPPEKPAIKWSPSTLDYIESKIIDAEVIVDIESVAEGFFYSSMAFLEDGVGINLADNLKGSDLARSPEAAEVWPPKKPEPKENRHEYQDNIVDITQPQVQAKLKGIEKDVALDRLLGTPEVVLFSAENTKRLLKKMDAEKTIYNGKLKKALIARVSKQRTPSNMCSKELRDFKKPPMKTRTRGYRAIAADITTIDLVAEEVSEFDCAFIKAEMKAEGFKVYLAPDLPILNEGLAKLTSIFESLQEGFLESYPSRDRSMTQLVLVKNRDKWMRGRVISIDKESADKVEVYLFEAASFKKFPLNKIFRMPQTVVNVPRLNVKAVLEVVASDDNSKTLSSISTRSKLHAKVKHHDEHDFPVVELFDDRGQPIIK